MGRPKKSESTETTSLCDTEVSSSSSSDIIEKRLTTNDIGWTDYVLSLLSDDEKISGNPTTDGLRRIFEIALDCDVIESISSVVQAPDPSNEKRATVVHTIGYILNNSTPTQGRALRRGLKLRKVVAAEELAKDIEDHPDHDTVNKITNNQINFMDVLSKRLDINLLKMVKNLGHDNKNIYNIEHESAVDISKLLSSYQQDISKIPEDIKGYDPNWK